MPDRRFTIHDPSDIRKPHSAKLENLGKVLDLDHKIINGYSTYNVVAITPYDKKINLVLHELYSNKDPFFLSSETVKNIEKDKEFENKAQATEIYNSKKWSYCQIWCLKTFTQATS